jgi:glycolate oxidase iron-sulfur subunit
MSQPGKNQKQPALTQLDEDLSYEQLIHCMRCGLCLTTCPTFDLYHIETASPRGRLSLMRSVAEERLEISDGFNNAMTLCLGCLACQTACPAGVPYGRLLELARGLAETEQAKKRNRLWNSVLDLLLKHLLYGPHGLEYFKSFLRIYQGLGLHKLNLARWLPGRLGEWERMLPAVASQSIHQALGEIVPAEPPVRGRVGLLTGCLENVLLSKMGQASAYVLARNGFEVVIPKKQVCCGALPAHIGQLDLARQQARDNIRAFEAAGVEIVISDAAGCSAQLKEYGHLLAGDPEYAVRAQRFSENAYDITEFLVLNFPLRDGLHPLPVHVAYDDPCHLIHGQKVSVQPRALLQSIPGLQFVELPEASWCCGSAGTYNLTHPQEAAALLERKMKHLRQVAPQILATANTGCYIQLLKGVREAGLDIEVCHVIELLERAYRGT